MGQSITKDEFLSKDLGGFVHDSKEDNFDIAKRIVEYFEARDDGHYGAIVCGSDASFSSSVTSNNGKIRSANNVRGKKIKIWKQHPSPSTNSLNTRDRFGTFITGLVTKNSKISARDIKDTCEDEFGGDYAAMVTSSDNVKSWGTVNSKHDFDKWTQGKHVTVWRQA